MRSFKLTDEIEVVDIYGSLYFCGPEGAFNTDVDTILEADYDRESTAARCVEENEERPAIIESHQGTMRISLPTGQSAYLTHEFMQWIENV